MTPRPRTPVSRRERPAKPALSRAAIVAAAVGVLRAEGLEKVTMRRLAQELDTGPASLYVYVANTAQLHAAVLDEMLGEVELAPEAGGDWRERLLRVLVSYTMTLFEHPALARAALVSRPAGEHYLRLVETLLALLDEGDVPPAQAAWGVDVLLLVATASAAEHATRAESGDEQHEWDELTAALRDAPAQTYPHLQALVGPLLSGGGGERMTWAFRMLLNGIAGTPVPGTETS